MRHRQMTLAYLVVPVSLLIGCRVAGGSTGAPTDHSLMAAPLASSITSLAIEPSRSASLPILRSSGGVATEEALAGRWVLQQVQTVDGVDRGSRPGQTTLTIEKGTLFAVDACSQQLQAQVAVDRSTLTLNGGMYGGGFGEVSGHPCGDPEAVAFWNTRGTIRWEIVHSRLVVRSASMTLTYSKG